MLRDLKSIDNSRIFNRENRRRTHQCLVILSLVKGEETYGMVKRFESNNGVHRKEFG